MGKISTVLFPTDFSECSFEAFKHALRICTTFDAHLILFHVMTLLGDYPEKAKEGFPEMEKLIDFYQRQNKEHFESYRRFFHDHIISYTEKSVRGFSVTEEILSFEKENEVDLIVMGTHGRGFFSHLVLGSEAERVTRYSSCPVMTVNMLGRPIEIADTYKRILVPLDFSAHSKAGLRYAISLGRMFNASVTIQYVFESLPHPMMHMQSADSQIAFNTVSKSEAETMIKEVVSEIDTDFKQYDMVVTEGRPYKEIIKCVEDTDIDLVIMSTRGYGVLESFFIGTTADKIIRKAECPVLAVKGHERDFILS